MIAFDRLVNLVLLIGAVLSAVAAVGALSTIILSFFVGDRPYMPLWSPLLGVAAGGACLMMRRAVLFIDPDAAELGDSQSAS